VADARDTTRPSLRISQKTGLVSSKVVDTENVTKVPAFSGTVFDAHGSPLITSIDSDLLLMVTVEGYGRASLWALKLGVVACSWTDLITGLPAPPQPASTTRETSRAATTAGGLTDIGRVGSF
jgi:hypothetical protein